jgi:hypothetical protein
VADKLGLWPWDGCCNGKVYSKFSECCCDGEVLSKAKVPSGIKRCEATMNYGSPWWPGNFDHVWIEIDGWSAGFMPTGSLWNGPGQVYIPQPDYPERSDKRCTELELSPCEWNIAGLAACIKDFAAKASANTGLVYNVVTFNCGHWASGAIGTCKVKQVGKKNCGKP